MASITDNLYYERYNNLKREEYNDFINTFLDSSKKKSIIKNFYKNSFRNRRITYKSKRR